MKSIALTLFAIIVVSVVVHVSGQGPSVNVSEGVLVGKTVRFEENKFINVTKDVDMYLGVPFANPPERFSPPEPKTPWSGVYNATEFSACCWQTFPSLYSDRSEDCLYLNVYTPSPKPSPNIPVMVWIHGGGFSVGSAMNYDYYGVPLVSVGDVIVVTINYRLAIFAQFSTEDSEAPGNYGMLDQVAALKWVYENIEAFGGDKDKITIFGESAGSASVSYHLISKLSRGYFTQAIMQSGTVFSPWAFRHDPVGEMENARELGRALNCTDVTSSAALVSCLRAVQDPLELHTAANQVYDGLYPVTLDGTFLEDIPANLYELGDFIDVPMIVGFNKDEGTLAPFFLYPEYIGSPTPPPFNRSQHELFIKGVLASYGIDDEIVYDAVLQEYTDWTVADDPAAEYFPMIVEFGGDHEFICPSDRLIRIHEGAGATVYEYFMTHEPNTSYFQLGEAYPSTPWLGAGHGEDLTFVWGIPFIEELYHLHGSNLTDEENALSVKFMQFWTNFAKSGDPSKPSIDSDPGVGQDFWPRYTIPELSHKEMSLDLGVGRAVRARECQLWNDFIPTLLAFAGTPEEEWKESYYEWKDDMTEWQQAFDEYQQQPTCN